MDAHEVLGETHRAEDADADAGTDAPALKDEVKGEECEQGKPGFEREELRLDGEIAAAPADLERERCGDAGGDEKPGVCQVGSANPVAGERDQRARANDRGSGNGAAGDRRGVSLDQAESEPDDECESQHGIWQRPGEGGARRSLACRTLLVRAAAHRV